MSSYAIIKDGLVINVVVWDGNSGWEPPEGTIAVAYDIDGDNPPGRGWTYDGKKFIPPKND